MGEAASQLPQDQVAQAGLVWKCRQDAAQLAGAAPNLACERSCQDDSCDHVGHSLLHPPPYPPACLPIHA